MRSAEASNRVAIVRFQPSDENDLRRETGAITAAGYDLDVICVRRSGEPARERLTVTDDNGRSVAVRVFRVRVDKSRGSAIGYVVQYAVWLVACTWLLTVHGLFRPYRSIQITTLPDHQVLAALLPRLRGTRVVVFFKEPAAELFATLYGGSVGRAVALTTGLAWRLADHCLCVTEAHRRSYIRRGVPSDRISVIGNATVPLPNAEPDPIASDRFVAVCHGTIEERWGHEVILRAAAIAREALPELQVVFTGSGSDVDRLFSLRAELDLNDIVEFRGWVSLEELSAVLARADVGLVAQLASPYSHLVHTGKMYDFFADDVPVIASDLHATREDFDGCCRFYTADDPQALADALIELAQDPSLRQGLVSAANQRMGDLGWDRLRGRYISAVLGTPEELAP